MKKNITAILLSLAFSSSLLTACNSEDNSNVEESEKTEAETTEETAAVTEYPLEVEIADFNGEIHKQTFNAAPERVITNNLSSIEMLMELGVGDKIVGTTQPDNEPTGKWADDVKDLNVIGDKMSMSQEIIAGENPDLVAGRSMMFDDEGIGSFKTLNDLDINAYSQTASNPTTVPELTSVIDDVKNLGEIFDVNERAEEYAAELEDRYNAVLENVEKNKGEEELTLLPLVAYDGANQKFNIFNITGGLQQSMLDALNIVPAIEGATQDPSFETVINANPDIILYVTADRNTELDETALDYIKNEPLFEDVTALREDRVYSIAYDDFMDYGIRIFDALEYLNEEVYNKE